MNSLEEEEGGEPVLSVSVCVHLASRKVGGWRVDRLGELQVAVSLPPPLWGTVERETPERQLGRGEVLLIGYLGSSTGADLGRGFPNEVELNSAWQLDEDGDGWEARRPCWVHPTLFCFRLLPKSWY